MTAYSGWPSVVVVLCAVASAVLLQTVLLVRSPAQPILNRRSFRRLWLAAALLALACVAIIILRFTYM